VTVMVVVCDRHTEVSMMVTDHDHHTHFTKHPFPALYKESPHTYSSGCYTVLARAVATAVYALRRFTLQHRLLRSTVSSTSDFRFRMEENSVLSINTVT
jgi:hypothetical protein